MCRVFKDWRCDNALRRRHLNLVPRYLESEITFYIDLKLRFQPYKSWSNTFVLHVVRQIKLWMVSNMVDHAAHKGSNRPKYI